MKKFEIGNVYTDSNGREYRVIRRTEKTVTIEDTKFPGNSLHQTRKTLKFHGNGSEYLEMVKGKAPSYRNHKKFIGRYCISCGKKGIDIHA